MTDVERLIAWASPVLALGFLLLVVKRHWPGRDANLDRVPGWWPYGDGLWRAWMRSTPGSCLVFVVLSAVAFMVAVFPIEESPVFTACALLIFPAMFVWLSVILFNRPRFLVAPRWRSAPGLLADWRRGFRSRRKEAKR